MKIYRPCLLGLVALAGCVSQPTSPSDISAQVEVRDTKFDKSVTYVAPQQSAGGWNTQTYYRLRGWRNKDSGALSHQLYVNVWYNLGSWRYYESASFVGGREVSVVKIDAKPRCSAGGGIVTCSYDEYFGVPLTTEFLEAARATGFEIQLNARLGPPVTVSVPATYVAGYLAVAGRQ